MKSETSIENADEGAQGTLFPAGRTMVSKSDYARHRGVSPSAVTRALAEGRIRATVINGRELLDLVATDAAWDTSTRIRRDALPPSPRGPIERPESDLSRQLKEATVSLQRAKAEQANLELDRASGLLLDRREVDAVLRELGTFVRVSVEGLPYRLAPAVAGLGGDAGAICAALESAFRELLVDIADAADRKASELPPIKEPTP